MIPTKRIIILLLLMISFATLPAQEILSTDSMTVDSLATDSLPPLEATMAFDLTSYHIGTIYDHTKPTNYTFFYCNVGQQGLVIKRIETTCGCKVTQYPTDSLYYDESGQIDIAIIPCKESGKFKKGIYVYTNAGTFRLTISGYFEFPSYVYQDASTGSAPENGYSVSVEDASTSSATEKKDKPIRQKKNKLSRKTKRLTE
ncbi:MAG: DUF1573 domain-containing protein [Paludibacteraceae bacterium]|nr:DUF1573 domain-containing protein [Paludibacteraceae bacterium]